MKQQWRWPEMFRFDSWGLLKHQLRRLAELAWRNLTEAAVRRGHRQSPVFQSPVVRTLTVFYRQVALGTLPRVYLSF